jgi:outer membrane lipoprotein-sorting protein
VKTLTVIALFGVASIAARAETLDAILARMDASSKTFKSVSASIKRSSYNELLRESEPEESGDLRIQRNKNAVAAVLDFKQPNAYTVFFKDKKAWVYHPKAKIAEEYEFSKNASTIDQFLVLGFGTSGEELRRNYEIKLGPAENIGSTPTTRVELVPRSDEVKRLITKIELWIPDGKSNAIREKISEPSGNYNLANYSNVNFNSSLPASAFDMKLPSDVKVVKQR